MASLPVLRNFIAGSFTDRAELHEVTNPATGAVLARSPLSSQADVDRAIAAARGTHKDWARRQAVERAQYLRRVAASIRDNAAR
ncbi:aldehyde dehydrogenase family protein, partial [Rhizobium ruizarguesonis]